MENEVFLSWGNEDGERYSRFQKLYFIIKRVEGPLFHIQHAKKVNSLRKNPSIGNNTRERERIREMSVADLLKEIETWPWLPQNRKDINDKG